MPARARCSPGSFLGRSEFVSDSLQLAAALTAGLLPLAQRFLSRPNTLLAVSVVLCATCRQPQEISHGAMEQTCTHTAAHLGLWPAQGGSHLPQNVAQQAGLIPVRPGLVGLDGAGNQVRAVGLDHQPIWRDQVEQALREFGQECAAAAVLLRRRLQLTARSVPRLSSQTQPVMPIQRPKSRHCCSSACEPVKQCRTAGACSVCRLQQC